MRFGFVVWECESKEVIPDIVSCIVAVRDAEEFLTVFFIWGGGCLASQWYGLVWLHCLLQGTYHVFRQCIYGLILFVHLNKQCGKLIQPLQNVNILIWQSRYCGCLRCSGGDKRFSVQKLDWMSLSCFVYYMTIVIQHSSTNIFSKLGKTHQTHKEVHTATGFCHLEQLNMVWMTALIWIVAVVMVCVAWQVSHHCYSSWTLIAVSNKCCS